MQRFASSLIACPIASTFSRSTLYRAMSVSAQQIKEHSIVYDSQGKEFAKVEYEHSRHTAHHPHSYTQLVRPAHSLVCPSVRALTVTCRVPI